MPLLSRIKMATIGVPDLNAVERWYTKWLGYSVLDRASIGESLAQSWGTLNTAGRPVITLQSAAKDDVYLRAVEIDPVPNYKAMTTWGWNAIEIIADDVDGLFEYLKDSDFIHVSGPENLMGGTSSIRAVQYKGPGEEVIYLTCETGDRDTSTLPKPRGVVDRPFVMVLAGPNIAELEKFYGDTFSLASMPHIDYVLDLVSEAQGRPIDTSYRLGLLRLKEKGNNIELDQYPTGTNARPCAEGQLPPGVSMASFSVDNLDSLDVNFIAEPIALYCGKRAATFVGPAGELTELIEDPRV
ncbi:MAG: VOC family protein [Rhodospirillaceae bacterium]|jgi:catechol 2,3-dioxygenase-like lactoylglutathione lyase family enzyme|nr:VOC family protein [Rhodospirillaceae bacterium]